MTELKLTNNCEKCTAGWKNFKHLGKNEIELLNSSRYEAAFRPGEVMVKQGTPSSNALFMATGFAKSYIEGNSGRNLLLEIEKPGNLILSPGAFASSRHNFSVAAITAVQSCFVNTEIIRGFARSNSAFAESLLTEYCIKSVRTHDRMVSMAQKRMSGRLADILIYLSDEIYGSNEFAMILTRQELGEMTGMAKECVVRILREFEDSGVIESDSAHVKVLNRVKLHEISQKG
jgi:CRP/FNR family transcriptional regulator